MFDSSLFKERVRQLERRLESSEKDRREIWMTHGESKEVMIRQGARIDHFEATVENIDKRMEDVSKRMVWVIGSLFTLSGTFLIAAVSITLALG